MIGSRILQLGCIALALNITVAHADRALRFSTKHLVADSSTVVVTHDHDVKPIKRPELVASDEDAVAFELNSTLRIVRKRDHVELFNQAVMPFTALTSVDGGRYFAGLSSLQALSFQYNFLLITADGRIVTTALITPTSGHCRAVSFSTTNYIRWFDEKAPDLQLTFAGGKVDRVIVANPYDKSADGTIGKCVIRVTPTNATRQ